MRTAGLFQGSAGRARKRVSKYGQLQAHETFDRRADACDLFNPWGSRGREESLSVLPRTAVRAVMEASVCLPRRLLPEEDALHQTTVVRHVRRLLRQVHAVYPTGYLRHLRLLLSQEGPDPLRNLSASVVQLRPARLWAMRLLERQRRSTLKAQGRKRSERTLG